MSRISVFDSKIYDLKMFLSTSIIIPMNQRQYEWEDKHTNRFFKDFYKVFKNTLSRGYLGSIIIYNNNNIHEIYDGQQRILSLFLLIVAINKVYDFPNIIWSIILTDDFDFNEETNNIKKKYKVANIPLIRCINPDDMESLCYIVNNKYKSPYEYMKVIKNKNEINKYQCECGNRLYKSYGECKKHIMKCKNIQGGRNKSTKLYKTYDNFIRLLKININNKKESKDFLRFIMKDIEMAIFTCNTSKNASQIFEYENNRGKNVDDLSICKNKVMQFIPDENKILFYNNWIRLQKKCIAIECFAKMDKKIFTIASQILIKNFSKSSIDINLENIKTEIEINKYLKIVEDLIKICQDLIKHKYGQFIFSKRNKIAWEGFGYLLIPFIYKQNKMENKIIKLCCKWYFRTNHIKCLTFNSVTYIGTFQTYIGYLYTDKINKEKYMEKIKEVFKKNLKDSNILNEIFFIETLSNYDFSNRSVSYVRSLLQFYNMSISTNDIKINDGTTLEHICSQKNKSENNNKLGNLTLYEGKNTEKSNINHKGNFALGAKEYKDKKKYYDQSCYKITRNIVKNYNEFSDKEIIDRTNKLSIEIEKCTRIKY
jgi:hypothetical protein